MQSHGGDGPAGCIKNSKRRREVKESRQKDIGSTWERISHNAKGRGEYSGGQQLNGIKNGKKISSVPVKRVP